jgi:hypothetical protein
VVEHSRSIDGIREAIMTLEQRMDRRFEGVDRRFDALERTVNERFAATDQRIDALDRKLDHRTTTLDDKMSRQFSWVVGIQVTTLVAIVAALLSR